jgi:CubicO group peptidase (beta-lactamase class C family)
MRRSGLAVLVLVTAMVSAACTSPPTPSADVVGERGMREYLDGLVEMRQFRGSVEVRRGDEVLLRDGFGQADVARDVPDGPGTRFRIGSVTKQFTALAVLILQEQGRLRVSDPVCTLLPDCPAAWRAITVEHLLTHTAGLWDYNELTEAESAPYLAEYGDTPTPGQLLRIFVDRPLESAPGSAFRYSNCGYDVLGLLVERLSGQTYGEFLHDRVLGPLGMSGTAYNPTQQLSDHDAIGYQDWNTPADTLPDAYSFASGGIYSTVTDLSRWNQFLLTGDPAVVERDTLDQLLRPRVDSGPVERYGYGVATRTIGGSTTHGHGGVVNGFRSHVLVQPATELSVVVLSNLVTVDPERVARTLTLLAGA